MKKLFFLLITAVGIFMANQANAVPPYTCTCMGGPEYMNPGQSAVFNVYPSQTITNIVVETQEGSQLYGCTTRTGNAITFTAPNYQGLFTCVSQ